jgi:starch synthase
LVVIGRLTFQKGFDLLIDSIPELMSMELQVIILGTGDHDLEQQLRAAKDEYLEKIGLYVGSDEGLAHRIEAGCRPVDHAVSL